MSSIKDNAIKQNTLIDVKPKCMKTILENKPSEREFLLYPWLPKAGLAMIYAAAGVGKTFFALNIAYAMAGGGDFLKFICPKPVRILYIDGEMTYKVMQPRIEMIAKAQGKLNDDSNFLLVCCDDFPNGAMPKLSTLEGQSFFNIMIADYKVDVVIVDNISTCTNLVENNAEEWNIMQDWQISLKAKNVGMILIHHTSKDGKNQRGTEKRKDIQDTCILLQEVNNGETEMASQFKITFDKSRGFFGEEAESFEASLDKDGSWHMKTQEQSTFDKVVELSNLGMSQAEIAIEVGINRSNVCRAFKKAKDAGLIEAQKKQTNNVVNIKKQGWSYTPGND